MVKKYWWCPACNQGFVGGYSKEKSFCPECGKEMYEVEPEDEDSETW